jgi:membrane protease YdiL (CAAX protease family)
MKLSQLFLNSAGRLRSGWRVTFFVVAFSLLVELLFLFAYLIAFAVYGGGAQNFLVTRWGYLVQAVILLFAALFVGWTCGVLFEKIPFAALGWARHRGWLRDLRYGTLIGAASLVLATVIAKLRGGFSFSFNATGMYGSLAKTLIGSAFVFILAAAAEESVFRSYPLQTWTRARLVMVGAILTSLAFAYAHQGNPNLNVPNVYPKLAFANTALAGFWLVIAWWRTRSLWLPLGIHWSWNWAMGSVLGLPVSGITSLAPTPLLRATDNGPAWLTGGAYGIEGGVACTVALIVSIAFVWRTKLLRATEDMKALSGLELQIKEEKPAVAESA